MLSALTQSPSALACGNSKMVLNFPPGASVGPAAVEKKSSHNEELKRVFAEVVEDRTAGLPTDEHTNWVSMKPADIQIKLQERDFEVSRHVVSQLLENHGLRRRSYLKAIRMGDFERRDDQFDKISGLKNRFLAAGLPVLSIDTKQKELLGNFHRQGHYYAQTHRKVNDHDFRSAADGLLVPHGIYDVGDNAGYLTLGTGTTPRLLFATISPIFGNLTCNGSTRMPNGHSSFVTAVVPTIRGTILSKKISGILHNPLTSISLSHTTRRIALNGTPSNTAFSLKSSTLSTATFL